jgi:hypothetical protein
MVFGRLLEDGPTGLGEVAKSGYLFVQNFNVTRSTVLMEAEKETKPNMTLSQH